MILSATTKENIMSSTYEIKSTKEIGDLTIVTVESIPNEAARKIYTIITHLDGIEEIVTPAGRIYSLLDNEIPVAISHLMTWFYDNV
jgi:hypothetical protein